jgi:tRNA(Ile)-lysidine synthase
MLLNVNNFYNELLKTININNSFLLCISGGLDSMVLLDLFLKCNLHIVVAHVNFNIRKHSSIRDAFFVKQFCEKQKIIFHYKELDIYNFMQINKFSVQMAARFMRYKWFNELCKKYNYNFMVLGHHLDDSIETFFINLFRGTGLQGLTGIKYIDNNILRPLTLFTRYQIFKYARINNILWREDVSNY